MLTPARVLLTGALALLGPLCAAQSPTPALPPKASPPLRLPFSALMPEATIAVKDASDFASTEGAMWAASRAMGEVSRIDVKTSAVAQKLPIGKNLCVGLAADFGGVFLLGCPNVIARIDSLAFTPGESISVPLLASARSIAAGVSSLWLISDSKGAIARIDPVANVVVAEIHTAPGASDLAFGEGALWVANPEKNTVTRINPYNNLIVESIEVAGAPVVLAVGEGAIWTWNRADGSIARINPKENKVEATIKPGLGAGDARIAAGEGSIWVSRAGATLCRIDPRTNHVAQIFTGLAAGTLAVAHGSVWIAASPGAVLRLDPRRIEATRSAVLPRPSASMSQAPSLVASPTPSPTPNPSPSPK